MSANSNTRFQASRSDFQLIQADCIEAMRSMRKESFDLIVADPPYNLSQPHRPNAIATLSKSKNFKMVREDWDTFAYEDYRAFTENWIASAMRLLKPSGSLFIFGTYHNSGVVNTVLQENAINIKCDITWYKRNAMPNLSGTGLGASTESIIWATKTKKPVFNYARMKEYPDDLFHKRGKQMRNIWDICTSRRECVDHPTQKPVALYKRIIDMTCPKNGRILDPFGGSGTLGIAANIMGKRCVMIERVKYCDVILERYLIHCLIHSPVEALRHVVETYAPKAA
jgi:DNA modification methylase